MRSDVSTIPRPIGTMLPQANDVKGKAIVVHAPIKIIMNWPAAGAENMGIYYSMSKEEFKLL